MPLEARAPQRPAWLLPGGVEPSAQVILIGRGLRAFADGYVAVLLAAALLMAATDRRNPLVLLPSSWPPWRRAWKRHWPSSSPAVPYRKWMYRRAPPT